MELLLNGLRVIGVFATCALGLTVVICAIYGFLRWFDR